MKIKECFADAASARKGLGLDLMASFGPLLQESNHRKRFAVDPGAIAMDGLNIQLRLISEHFANISLLPAFN